MNSLFQGFLNALKARIVPLWTKIRLFTSPSYIKGELLRRMIQFVRKMTDVRPRDKKDYYGFFGWLISKRLAFLIVVTIGMFSAYYVTIVQPLSIFTSGGDGIKTYAYNSIPLRFTEGMVRIEAKSGYKAYEGYVSEGYCKGLGKLFRKNGTLVYEGQFDKNMFNGTGTSYYPMGQVEYIGSFQDNVYSGLGNLFRENGTKEYEGQFLNGMKDGAGTLYDSGSNKIFSGNFSKGNLLYTDFLRKSTVETGQIYMGKKMVYSDDEYFVVDMPDISGITFGLLGEESLANEVMVEGVYVLKNEFPYGEETYTEISEIARLMGDAVYEGNTYLNTADAVAVHVLNQERTVFSGDVSGEWNAVLSDSIVVESYDPNYSVYLYTFVKDKLRYTFFCKDRSGTFEMYLIENQQ